MGERTGIAWCDHTFNPWRGCTKVSAGCASCYAETLAKRNPAVLGEWGPEGKRVVAAESYWKLPERWNRAAMKAGVRRRVFCASLADVFEDRVELVGPRRRLFSLIAVTPWLDWLLLTKRPENVIDLWPGTSVRTVPLIPADGHRVFQNLWLGVSVEDQRTADARIPELLRIPVAMRFVSYEPMLGPVRFDRVPGLNRAGSAGQEITRRLWIIVGGESGSRARACDVDWMREVVFRCGVARVPVFVKQLGALWYDTGRRESLRGACAVSGLVLAERGWRFVEQEDRAGADPKEWPEDLRVRQFPEVPGE